MHHLQVDLDVSKNRVLPNHLIGFSIINHPFWGTPIFANTHLVLKVGVVLGSQGTEKLDMSEISAALKLGLKDFVVGSFLGTRIRSRMSEHR